MRKLNIVLAEESDIIFHDQVPVGWRIGSNRFWPVFWLIAFIVGFLALLYGSRPKVVTPFVTSLIDLLDPKSSWVISSLEDTGTYSFLLSALFILVLTALLYQVFYGTVKSIVREQYGPRRLSAKEVEQLRAKARPGQEVDAQAPVKQTERFYRTFKRQPFWYRPMPRNFKDSRQNRWLWRLSYVPFVAMLVFNTWLFTYFFDLLNGMSVEELPPAFAYIYVLAIFSRLVCLFIAASTLLQYFYHDFSMRIGRFLSNYIRYFYPAIVSIAIIAFVFSQMGQFDAFFIELVQNPGQLGLFSVCLFPVSIAVIWFGPSYSFFTDQRFAHREDSYSTLHALIGGERNWAERNLLPFGWLVLHVRLFLRGDEVFKQVTPPQYYLPLNVNKVPPPSVSFTMLRDLLGIFYIYSLISICHKIYFSNSLNPAWWIGLLPLAALGLVLVYWLTAKTAFRNSEKERNRARRIVDRPAGTRSRWFYYLYKLRDRNVYKPIGRQFFYVRQQWPFWIAVVAMLLAGVLFVLAFYHGLVGSDWSVSFFYFLAFLYVSLFFFVGVTLFEPFYKRYTFDKSLLLQEADKLPDGHPVLLEETSPSDDVKAPKYAPYVTVAQYKGRETNPLEPPVAGQSPYADRCLSGWDTYMDAIGHYTIQLMLILLGIAVVAFIYFFLHSLISNFSLSSVGLQSLNPLNVYLVLINGFIAFLFFTGRFLMVREQTKVFRFHAAAAKEAEKEAVNKAKKTAKVEAKTTKPSPKGILSKQKKKKKKKKRKSLPSTTPSAASIFTRASRSY